MSRRALSLIAAALVLVVATAATAASASKPVTPKLGTYESPVTGSSLREVVVGTVGVGKVGKGRVGGFNGQIGLTCPHSSGGEILKVAFGWVAAPFPIKNGKFALNRMIHAAGTAVGGSGRPVGTGTGTTRFVVSGTFKSATKVVVKTSATGTYDVHYFDDSQPDVKVKCTGKQTATAKFKRR